METLKREETRGWEIWRILDQILENLDQSCHLLLLLLYNHYLVSDDILVLLLFFNFWGLVLHESITQCEKYTFSEYSECFGKIMKNSVNIQSALGK